MNETFGQRLARIRKGRGLTQAALGERMGAPQQHVARWENGGRQPTAETLKRLSLALDIRPGVLLGLGDGS